MSKISSRRPTERVSPRVVVGVKRVAIVLAAGAALFAAVVGVEVVLALRRDYLPTEPALDIAGVFGPPDAPSLKFVVLGDSTSAGVGAGSPERSFPVVLAERLAGPGRRVTLRGLGVSGARVQDVLRDQVPQAAGLEPDLILVAIGANDVTHLTPLSDIESGIGAIVEELRRTGAPVVVAGAPDMRAAAFYEPLRTLAGWRGRVVTRAIERAARSRGATVVPLALRTGPFFDGNPAAYSADEFHPGPKGYARWADAIYPALEEALEDR